MIIENTIKSLNPSNDKNIYLLSTIGRLFGLLFMIVMALIYVFIPWYSALLCWIALLITVICILKPEWGLYLLILLVPITTFSAFVAIKNNWNFIIGNNYIDLIPIYLPVIAFSYIGFIFSKWGKIRSYQVGNPIRIPLAILLLYSALTIFWSENVGHCIFQCLVLLMNIILFLLIISLISDEETHKKVMWLWLISISLQAVISIVLFFGDTIIFTHNISPDLRFGFSVYGGFEQESGWPQVAAGLQDHHETALILNMVLPVAIGLFLTSKKRLIKVALIVIMIFIIFVTLRTESRAGFIALFVMVFSLFLTIKRFRRHFLLLCIFFSLFVVGTYILQDIAINLAIKKEITPRILFLGSKVVETGDFIDPGLSKEKLGRIKLWKGSFNKYKESWIQGFGVGNLKYYLDAPHAHSIYFSLLFDFGLIGVFCLLLISLRLTRIFLSSLRYQGSYLQIMSIAFFGGFIAVAIHGLVDFEYNTTSIWIFFGLLVGTFNLLNKEIQGYSLKNQ